MRKTVLSILITLLGSIAIWAGTDGFHAFTSEGARRYEIQQQPRSLPDVTLEDQNGQRFKLSDYRGKPMLFSFFYARCGDTCPALGTQFRTVFEGIRKQPQNQDVVFLSISFDPEHDHGDTLQNYSEFLHADGVNWRVATVPDKKELAELLKACDVTVIPDQYGGFEHNAAIYAADKTSRLIRIFDYNAPDSVTQQAASLFGSSV